MNGKVEAEEAKVQICLVKQIGVKAYYYQALQSVKICAWEDMRLKTSRCGGGGGGADTQSQDNVVAAE